MNICTTCDHYLVCKAADNGCAECSHYKTYEKVDERHTEINALVAENKCLLEEIEKTKCEIQILREQLGAAKHAETALKVTNSVLNLIFAGKDFYGYE